MAKYKAIKIDGVKHDEHRYIMEQYLGRKLDRNEIVHHLNENKLDNDISNLQLMTRSEHAKLHRADQQQSEEARQARSDRMKGQPNFVCRKLSEADVIYVKTHYKPRDPEYGLRAMARKLGVGHQTLSRIIHGTRYKEIE